MQNSIYYRLGKLIYRLRWYIISLWILFIAACIPFIPDLITPFKTTGFIADNAPSTLASKDLNKTLKYNGENKILIIYTSKTLLSTNPLYLKEIKRSLANLRKFTVPHEILLPDNKQQRSKDKHTSYAVIIFKEQAPLSDESLAQFKSLIKKPTNMTMQLGGQPIFMEDVQKQTQLDLYNADFIATPVAIITLILIFGSLFAVLVPVFLGGGCALIILTMLYFLGHVMTLSIFTLNIALLLGLCLSLDYSLFIISRFRDELKNGGDIAEAIAITEATAGKAIFFSGLAVFASLSALLLFPINILFSVAVGGTTAVFIAVLIAITLLPAILAVLNTRINSFSINLFAKSKFNFWHWMAEKVVNRPYVCFFSILIFLLMLGYPVLFAKFGVSDFRIFPQHSEHRRFFDSYAEKFNEEDLTPIQLLIKTQSRILSRDNLTKIYDLAHKLKRNPLIDHINSIVTTDPELTKAQYYAAYNSDNSSLKKILATTTRQYLTVMDIISKYQANTPETRELIDELHNTPVSNGMSIELTGTPVSNFELMDDIAERLPFAILWIVVFTYLILLILLRSVFLPLKAILMNILSLCACYGALVLVFQEGYLHEWLNFQPQGKLDVSLLVIIFCALFGFSMDYEVFLLSRIKEAYDATGDNKQSIIVGIEKSSRIITSAAIIVIFICGAFLVADVLMVKAFGLGIAVAIFVDAFLIRTILVPATMTLIEKWNWYLPKWLDKRLPDL